MRVRGPHGPGQPARRAYTGRNRLVAFKIAAEIIPVDAELVDLATQAWLTFGKGRHPASLNFADCFSYALAKRADDALLFIGEDFKQTDIEAA